MRLQQDLLGFLRRKRIFYKIWCFSWSSSQFHSDFPKRTPCELLSECHLLEHQLWPLKLYPLKIKMWFLLWVKPVSKKQLRLELKEPTKHLLCCFLLSLLNLLVAELITTVWRSSKNFIVLLLNWISSLQSLLCHQSGLTLLDLVGLTHLAFQIQECSASSKLYQSSSCFD